MKVVMLLLGKNRQQCNGIKPGVAGKTHSLSTLSWRGRTILPTLSWRVARPHQT